MQDPSKIDANSHKVWCNLHITPALEGIIVEVHSLEEVTHWAKKKHLGSSLDPTEPGVANLIVALGSSPLALYPQFGQGAGCLKPENVFSC